MAGVGAGAAACSDDPGDSSDAQVSTDSVYGAPGMDVAPQDAGADTLFYADVSTDSVYGAPDGPFLQDSATDGADAAGDGGTD